MSSRLLRPTPSDEEASEDNRRRSQRAGAGSKRPRDAATYEELEAAIADLEASPERAPEKSDDESPSGRRDGSPCRPRTTAATGGDSDGDGDGEDDAVAEEAEAVDERWHQLTWAKGPAPLRRRYKILRSNRSWLEKPPTSTFRLPKRVPDGSPAAITAEREFSKVVAKERKLWERCVRICVGIDNRNKSIGSNKSSAPSSEQAALKRAKEKDAVRQATKDARNEHFQSVVDQDIEIRDSIASTMQARVQSSERLSRAFELIAIATLTANLGAAAAGPLISQLFGDNNASRAPVAPAAAPAAPPPAPAPDVPAPAPGASAPPRQ